MRKMDPSAVTAAKLGLFRKTPATTHIFIAGNVAPFGTGNPARRHEPILPAPQRKEGADNSQSNRSSTAHPEHVTSGGRDVASTLVERAPGHGVW